MNFKIWICFFCVVFSFSKLAAQENNKIPRLEKVAISNSGTFAYFPKTETAKTFDISYSEDSAKIYTGDFIHNDFHFAIIVVKMKENMHTKEEKENMMIAYLDYLQLSFEIKKTAGYGKGHTLESSPKAVGIIDYWQDKEEEKWAVKAWADGNILSVMMLYGAKEYPIFNIQQMFLDGFRFK